MTDTRSLRDLYAYNAWANAQVFAAARTVGHERQTESAPGTVGTVEETLKHMVGVEDVYAQMLRRETLGDAGVREEYYTHDLEWFAERSAALGEAYAAILDAADEAYFDERLRVPWFDFALTMHDGLLQVLSHSAQHRTQVFSVFGGWGMETPSLDYVAFVESRSRAAQ